LGKITALQNGFVKRRVSTSAKVPPKDFDAGKASLFMTLRYWWTMEIFLMLL